MRFFLTLLFFLAGCLTVFAQEEVLSVSSALEIAQKNAPDIQQVKLELERRRELLNAQEAGLKSRFSLNLLPFEYSKERTFSDDLNSWRTSENMQSQGVLAVSQPIIWTDGTIALRNQFGWRDSKIDYEADLPGLRNTNTNTFSNNLYLSLEQPLFTYNRTRLDLQSVELDLENAQINYALQNLQLEKLVTQYFYDAFKAKMSYQVAKEELQNTDESYQIIKNKVDAGLVAKEELYQAELNLANSQSALYNSEVTLQNALDQLKQQIGMSLYEEISIVADVDHAIVTVDIDRALEHGLAHRLELRERKIDLEVARVNLIKAAATNEFKGNLSLSYGIIGDNGNVREVYDAPTKNQKVSLSLEVPIFDWGESASRRKAAEASRDQSSLNLNEEKKTIIIAIRRAFRSLNNQALQIEIARKNVQVAQLTYDINLERYENGDLTSMDLNLYQNQLSQKKNDLVDAMIAYKMALLEMKIQSLWDFEMKKPVLKISNEDHSVGE